MQTARTKKGRRTGTPRFLDQYPEICSRVYELRYVTASIMHRALPDIYDADTIRTAQFHLASLEQLNLIKSRRSFVNTPKVFFQNFLTLPKLLRDCFPHERAPLPSRDETTAPDLIRHELAISNLQTDFHLAAASHPQLEVVNEFRRFNLKGFELPYTSERGTRQHVEPDLMTLLRITGRRQFILVHFFEIDLGNESPLKVFNKLLAYAQWYEQHGERYLLRLYSEAGERDPKPTFRLLFVTRSRSGGADADRLRNVYEFATMLPNVIRKQLFMTTDTAAQMIRDQNGILTRRIWYPVRAHGAEPVALYRGTQGQFSTAV